MKCGIEQMLAHQRGAHLLGILRDHRLELRELTVVIENRPAEVRFADPNLILKSHRMADLIHRGDVAGDASLDNFAHPIQIAIEEIDMVAVDEQPSAAVDAGAPCAE